MITISISACNLTYILLGSLSEKFQPRSAAIAQWFDVPRVMFSLTAAPITSQVKREIGRIYRPDGPHRGTLRDKPVYHTAVAGDLQISTRSITWGSRLITGVSYPYGRSTQGDVVFSGTVIWGSDYEANYSHRWTPVSVTGVLYTQAPSTSTYAATFSGVYCIFSQTTVRAATYADGVPFRSADVFGIHRLFRRDVDGRVYEVKLLSLSGRPSKSELWVAFAGWMYPGLGTACATTVLLPSSELGDPTGLANAFLDKIAIFEWPHLLLDLEPVDYGELAVHCAQQMNYVDSTVLSVIFDIRDWGNFHKMWRNLLNTEGWRHATYAFKAFRSGHGKRKHLRNLFNPSSSLYLFGTYAVMPTSHDVRRLYAGVADLATRPARARIHSRQVVPLDYPGTINARFTAVLTVVTGTWPLGISGKIQELIGLTKRWGIYPNLTALADVVKYSFVVNWFIQFSETLSDCDRYLDVKNYFPVEYCIQSAKWEVGYTSVALVPSTLVTGDVVYSHYHRWISSSVPLPSVDPLRRGSGLLVHGVEATALVLQRLK